MENGMVNSIFHGNYNFTIVSVYIYSNYIVIFVYNFDLDLSKTQF